MRRLKDSAGQTLIEISIAMTILSVVLLAAASTAASSSRAGTDSYLQFMASNYVQQGLQQMLIYRGVNCPSRCQLQAAFDQPMSNWATDSYLDTSLSEDPADWKLKAPTTPEGTPIAGDSTGKFKRYIVFTQGTVPGLLPVSNILEVKVEVHVTWHDQTDQKHDVSQGTALADWKAAE